MKTLNKFAIFGIIIQIGGIIYVIINNAEDVLVMSLIFLLIICIPLFDRKKSK